LNMSKTKATKNELSIDQLVANFKKLQAETPETTLASFINKSKISQPILINSNQNLRIKRLINWLKEVAKFTDNQNFTTFFGSELNSQVEFNSLLETICNNSLFSKFEIVAIYDVDKIKTANAKKLLDKLSTLREDILLLFITGNSDSKSTLITYCTENSTILKFNEVDSIFLKKFIANEIQRINVASSIETDAVALLDKYYAKDLDLIVKELEKLSLIVGKGNTIKASDVVNYSINNSNNTSFELFNSLFRQTKFGSVKLLNNLLEQGMHPLQINSFLSKSTRSAIANKHDKSNIPQELSNPWFLRQISGAQNAATEGKLINLLAKLKLLDFRLKDSKLTSETEIKNTLLVEKV
ncbi:MAG: DNA polymerase III subunit delta, partial [Proteobacteria bacterium]|nr:DNA polymerase III subunit delta [Pseudomonadota bacterium]